VLLARRLRTRTGELDLVMRDGGTLVVVEVKTGRAGPRFRPAVRIAREDLERRWRAAAELARGGPHRVDVVEVRLAPLELLHLRGLRQPP
jgi:putative endonuclease